MSKVLLLRALVEQRLTAAAEEIFGLFERTIAEYEEELCRSKEENERKQKLLDAVFKPQLRLHRSDIQQLLVCKEEILLEQQERSSFLDQEDPPQPPHIKEEEEELWTNQEGEQLQGLDEADVTKSMSTPVPVRSDDYCDKERPQSSELHHRQSEELEIEADGEDCGGPEPAKNSEPERLSHCETNDQTEVSSDPEADVNDNNWQWTREAPSGFQRPSGHFQPETDAETEVIVDDENVRHDDLGLDTIKNDDSFAKLYDCSECGKCFKLNCSMKTHMRIHAGENPPNCSLCHKQFSQYVNLQLHMKTHTGEKTYCCTDCGKCFKQNSKLKIHMRIHTGEKPFSCSVCGKSFSQKTNLQTHYFSHTGKKPHSCSVCGKRFGQKTHLQNHFRSHTGEKPYICSLCGKRFSRKAHLQNHFRCHTGEKPYGCSVCGRRFRRKAHLQNHFRCHTVQKPYS